MSSCTIIKSNRRRRRCGASVRWYRLGREVTCLMLQFLPAFANNHVMCSSLFQRASKSRLDRPLILPSYHRCCLVFFLSLPLLLPNPPNPFFLTHSATSISAHCEQLSLHVLSRPLYKVKSSRALWTSSTPLPQLTPHQAQHRPRYAAVRGNPTSS